MLRDIPCQTIGSVASHRRSERLGRSRYLAPFGDRAGGRLDMILNPVCIFCEAERLDRAGLVMGKDNRSFRQLGHMRRMPLEDDKLGRHAPEQRILSCWRADIYDAN